MQRLKDIVRRNKEGQNVGIYSVCSAHPLVLEGAMLHANQMGSALLIEATSNQVDQNGGYTGMTPADFREFVGSIADKVGLERERIILGGDHLGPNRWQGESAEIAMRNAEILVEHYVSAGFGKIHLDCSMSCSDDPRPLSDDVVATRAARLATIAERTAIAHFDKSDIHYIVGTEVPVPGGAQESLEDGVIPTSPAAAQATLDAHRQAFQEAGLERVWTRVVGLVVQPGVEFDHQNVVDYRRESAQALSQAIANEPNLVYEAHSTDYQTPTSLANLVEDHFAILKVGPGLTFALREALFALEEIEHILVDKKDRSNLSDVVERRMKETPSYWENHYHGSAEEIYFARRFSLSDRIRYYWPDSQVQEAQQKLIDNLDKAPLPLPLLSQYMPNQYRRIRENELEATAHSLIIDHIVDVLRDYAAACLPKPSQGTH
ncbi:D-tagatose-bisphosphate aldolase, class II, non-catalytic subunit [Halomonas sp. HP20-15]|uniref:D-tagatose-bisphosphate aldolase, class II, non-catalytic subunit n=1 Tax=Halomonas sp. HP20-15 TaxID=3085901 RepID=UPI0029828FE6|nr:D-tagatose-bisphosphate aldolase, class II, non-catalytic subunit [Halomonas sp. HP20-15]MDW5377528.1 D-tagatose-bisphosphate aldolase, class II, non-catalytic subunit [Halomonas sp. HP20-15]